MRLIAAYRRILMLDRHHNASARARVRDGEDIAGLVIEVVCAQYQDLFFTRNPNRNHPPLAMPAARDYNIPPSSSPQIIDSWHCLPLRKILIHDSCCIIDCGEGPTASLAIWCCRTPRGPIRSINSAAAAASQSAASRDTIISASDQKQEFTGRKALTFGSS